MLIVLLLTPIYLGVTRTGPCLRAAQVVGMSGYAPISALGGVAGERDEKREAGAPGVAGMLCAGTRRVQRCGTPMSTILSITENATFYLHIRTAEFRTPIGSEFGTERFSFDCL